MQENNNRNTIIFVVSAVLILIAYQFLVVDPATKRRTADMVRQKAATVETQKPGVLPSATPGTVVVSREQAAAASTRAPITTPALSGSVSLRGARIDDLFLKNYRQTVDKT